MSFYRNLCLKDCSQKREGTAVQDGRESADSVVHAGEALFIVGAAGRNFMGFAQICDLKQTGDQLAGPCRGPNGGCSAIGVISGANVDMTCRTSFTNAPNLAGISTFHGALGADEIVRGSCSHSRFPGANGVFAMMRV
jgi:hypothetical protein